MSQSKKQSFLHGAALLAAATIIVKVIGAFYKLPLNQIIGSQGFGYFNTAYNIYTVLLMISTAGLPVALSRMISQDSSAGNYNQLRRTFRTAQTIFLVLGVLGAGLMTFFAKPLAAWLNSPNSWVAIACLGPSALLICLMSGFRGFFQGQSDMIPTSVSQVLEAACKLVVGLGLAWVIYDKTGSIPYAAGGAILGVTIGCLLSTLFLYGRFRPAYAALPKGGEEEDSYAVTVKNLMRIAVPITIGSAGLQILNMIEIRVYMGQLLNLGYTQDRADTMKGIYDMSQTIFNLPCSLVVPLTISSLPVITSMLTRKRYDQIRQTSESAYRITGLICAPCSVGLFVLGEPVMALLGGYTGEDLALAGKLMSLIGVCVLIYALVMLTNSILQAHGHATAPAVHMFIGGLVKLGIVYVLTGNPDMGILGMPVAAIVCYASILAMNMVAMSRMEGQKARLFPNLLRSVVASVIMGVVVWGVLLALRGVLSADSTVGKVLLCGAPIAVGGCVYLLLAVKCKCITRSDCELLPKGKKIADFLRL